jgi:lipopolysaccharide transport system ATP-binding protein
MYVRLAFAVAAYLESEILIVDEVLAVGDAEFQKKCLGKMGDITKGEGRTVLFVSHNLAAVKSLCNRGILLENGVVNCDNGVLQALTAYQKNSNLGSYYLILDSKKEIFVKAINFASSKNNFKCDENILIDFLIEYNSDFGQNKFLIVRVFDNLDQPLFSSEVELKFGKKNYQLTIQSNFLVKGFYKLNSIIYHPAVTQYDIIESCCEFSIIENNSAFAHLEKFDIGKVNIPNKWN